MTYSQRTVEASLMDDLNANVTATAQYMNASFRGVTDLTDGLRVLRTGINYL